MERRNLNLYQDFRAGVNAFVRSAVKFELSAPMTSKRGSGVVSGSDRYSLLSVSSLERSEDPLAPKMHSVLKVRNRLEWQV